MQCSELGCEFKLGCPVKNFGMAFTVCSPCCIIWQVDDGKPRTIVNEGEKLMMDIDSDQPLFIGGIPQTVHNDAFKKWHLRNTRSFRGLWPDFELKYQMKYIVRTYALNHTGVSV